MSLVSEGAELARPPGADFVRAEPSLAGVEDYVALLKPRVMSLVVFTALVGLLVAPGQLHPVIGFTALLCIAIGAGASGALNMWYDADIDAIMTRTANRPIPAGRVQPGEALAFGATLAVFSVAVLGMLVNWFAAALLAFTIFFYVVRLYDVAEALDAAEHRDRRRGRCVSADDRLGRRDRRHPLEPVLMFLIIFFWTPPHFWALALLTRRRIRARRRADAAGGRRSRRDAQADPDLFARRSRRSGLRPRCSALPAISTARSRSPAARMMVALAWRVYRDRTRTGGPIARRRSSSPSRSSMCSCCSPRCSPTICWRGSGWPYERAAIAMTGSCSPRSRSAAAARARSRSRSSLGVFVVLFYVGDAGQGTGGADPAVVTMTDCNEPATSPPPRHRSSRPPAACSSPRMVGAGLCGGAVLQLVLPRDRLRRHAAGRDAPRRQARSAARSRCASTPTSRRPAVALRARDRIPSR